MSRVEIPYQDAQFANWVKRFANNAAVFAAELNLTPDEVDALTEAVDNFREAYSESQAAKAFAAGKVSTKDELRKACEDLIRPTARVINASPSISTQVKANLGINVSPTATGPVQDVDDLVGHGFANGVNALAWSRNGNAKNTTFLIEAMYEHDGVWVFAGITTKTKFNHIDQIPGRNVVYRVFAARGDVRSGASNWASIYEIARPEDQVPKLAA